MYISNIGGGLTATALHLPLALKGTLFFSILAILNGDAAKRIREATSKTESTIPALPSFLILSHLPAPS
jgi:ABC-type Na+ efflux pump permease subunit